MAFIDVGGQRYRFRRLCAYDQWTLLQRLHPLIPVLTGMEFGLRLPSIQLNDVMSFLKPLSLAKDEDLTAVFEACLAACERQSGDEWKSVPKGLGISDLVQLSMGVVTENFGPMFAMARPQFRPVMTDQPAYKPVSMPNDEDWLFRPVLRQLCRAESLYDGTLRIEHIAKLNDALNVADENETRVRKAAEAK